MWVPNRVMVISKLYAMQDVDTVYIVTYRRQLKLLFYCDNVAQLWLKIVLWLKDR